MKLRTASLYLLTIGLLSLPAVAQNDLYDDGPTDGTTDGWTINNGFVVSDTFTLAGNSTVNGLNFATWMTPGDVLESVEVLITSEEFGGVTYFDQQVNVVQSGCTLNQYGFDICNEVGNFSGLNMNAGTYWLNLENGVVNNGDPVYWDENRGPSSASENEGTIPSESFTILGSSGSSGGTTPEPGSVVLLGTGVFGLGTILRRKLF